VFYIVFKYVFNLFELFHYWVFVEFFQVQRLYSLFGSVTYSVIIQSLMTDF